MPFRGLGSMKYTGGALDDEGRPLESSLLYRGGQPVVHTESIDFREIEECADEVVFGGYMFPHFGHFTLETLARLWYIRRHPDIPIVFTPRMDSTRLLPWQAEILDRMGILARTRLLTCPTRFRLVHIPEAAFEIRGFGSAEYVASLQIMEGASDPRDRLWLSRRAVDEPKNHGNVDAAEIESTLAAQGWRVVQPELHTVSVQLDLLADARHIAGDEGAAFHLLPYVKFRKAPRVDVFARQAEVHQNYRILADYIDADHRFHSIERRNVFWKHRNRVRFGLPDPGIYIERLRRT